MSSFIRTTPRIARKPHGCERCFRQIQPGERYAEHVAAPNHTDLGNTGWWRLAECAPCCASCRRPLPDATTPPAADGQTSDH